MSLLVTHGAATLKAYGEGMENKEVSQFYMQKRFPIGKLITDAQPEGITQFGSSLPGLESQQTRTFFEMIGIHLLALIGKK